MNFREAYVFIPPAALSLSASQFGKTIAQTGGDSALVSQDSSVFVASIQNLCHVGQTHTLGLHQNRRASQPGFLNSIAHLAEYILCVRVNTSVW